MGFNERKIRILEAIINDYIETAEPIGSRTIAKKYDLGISSATIRNEMSDLEEMGFIIQPHASAGRVPSDKGYRLYVDSLMAQKELSAEETDFLKEVVMNNINQIEYLMKESAKAISKITNYTAVVSEPYGKKSTLKYLQLVPVDEHSLVVMIVNDSNVVKNQMIRMNDIPPHDILNTLSLTLSQALNGSSTNILTSDHLQMLEQQMGDYRHMLPGILEAVIHGLQDGENIQLYTSGIKNILSFPEFSDLVKARAIFQTLEEKDMLISLFGKNPDDDKTVNIVIGSENEIVHFHDCSIIRTSYSLGDKIQGSIGIVGPTRMDYSQVVSVLKSVVHNINSVLQDFEGG